jgi:hypothetical protein
MIAKIIRRYPLLTGIILIPITFGVSFLVGLFGLLLLDGLLIHVGVEAGFVFRVFIAPIGALAMALIACCFVVFSLREYVRSE